MAYTTTCPKPHLIFQTNRASQITVCSRTIRATNLPKPRGATAAIFKTPNVGKHLISNPKKRYLIVPLANSDSTTESFSPSDAVKKFYTGINEKNLKELEELISDDCMLEDSTFLYDFQGKKAVLKFLRQLAESMGENVQFRIGHVCVGDELTAFVEWHLEWDENVIPCSRGCSIFQFSKEDKLLIRKANIITETPFKPGKLAMALLKIVTSLFNDFPKAAKWFLKSPNTLLQAVLNVYNLLLAPFTNPVLAFYITIWKFAIKALRYVFRLLHLLTKLLKTQSSNGDSNSLDKS